MKDNVTQNIRTYCVHCRSLCGVIVTVENGRLTKIAADFEHPNGGITCPKGRAVPELVYNKQRLRYPLMRTRPKGSPDPGWKRVSWNEALEYIANKVTEITENYGPEALVISHSASGGSPSRDYRVWVRRLANVLNTPNLLSTSYICNWHRDKGTKLTFGVELPQPDFQSTQCVLLWGFNPARTMPTFYKALKEAVKRGAKLIVVDPYNNEVAKLADYWLQVFPGSDEALVLSLIHTVITEHLYDLEFVLNWTNAPFLVWEDSVELVKGAEFNWPDKSAYVYWDKDSNMPQVVPNEIKSRTFSPVLDGTWSIDINGKLRKCSTVWHLLKKQVSRFTPEVVESIVRVSPKEIRDVAFSMAKNRPLSVYTYNGIEQHTNATSINRAICILYALFGDFDKVGGNIILPEVPVNSLEGKEYISNSQKKKRIGSEKRPLGPAAGKSVSACDFYQAVLNSDPYPVKGMLSFGGNILLANSESLTGVDALKRLDLYVVSDLFMTPSANYADVVLPAASVWEGWGLRTSFIRAPASTNNYVQLRSKIIDPLYECKPDEEIIFELAKHLGFEKHFWNGNLEEAYNYCLEPAGLNVSTLRKNLGGIGVTQTQTYEKYKQKGFKTPSGLVEIFSEQLRMHDYPPMPVFNGLDIDKDVASEFPLILTNSKSRYYCHSQHRAVPSLRKRIPEPVLHIHPLTAKQFDIRDSENIFLETPEGKIRVKAAVAMVIPEGVVSMQHGWWQSCDELNLPGYNPFSQAGSNVNLIISSKKRDPVSGSVPHKSYPCRLVKE